MTVEQAAGEGSERATVAPGTAFPPVYCLVLGEAPAGHVRPDGSCLCAVHCPACNDGMDSHAFTSQGVYYPPEPCRTCRGSALVYATCPTCLGVPEVVCPVPRLVVDMEEPPF